MRKFVSIVCIIFLLIATSNLEVNIHFCGGKISSIDFFGKNKGCGSCDSKGSSDKVSLTSKTCCQNIAAVISADDSTASYFTFQTEQQAVAIIPVCYTYRIEFVSSTDLLKNPVASNAPPNITSQPYYILYRSLII